MIHIWWECPLIQLFWQEVNSIISQVTTYTLNYNPAQYLLHHTTLPKQAYYKSLAMHMVNATRLCIPIHWQSTASLSIQEWLTRVARIEEMEELIYTSQERLQKFLTIFASWKYFQTTEKYKTFFPSLIRDT